jgi:hypothetical protein
MYCKTLVLGYAVVQGRPALIVHRGRVKKSISDWHVWAAKINKDRYKKNSPMYKECFHCSNEGIFRKWVYGLD